MTVTLCLVLLMLGSTPSGLSEGPLGRVWLSLPHLVSPVWKSTGNCIGGFPVPPRSGVAFPTTSGLYCLEFDWQVHRGVSECPLSRVWPSLPHLVSTVWNSTGNCPGTQTQLSEIITQRPNDRLLDLWSRMFNLHQAKITVMQFRGYSLPVHDCNGRMGPSPFPIS